MGDQSSNANAMDIDMFLHPNLAPLSSSMANGSVNGRNNFDMHTSERVGGCFDCNICLILAKDPVVTFCGHLFCWPCLYQWLYLRSCQAKVCPVCKGEIADKNVIPIYGVGTNEEVHQEENSSPTLQIPPRPNARRVAKNFNARERRRIRRFRRTQRVDLNSDSAQQP